MDVLETIETYVTANWSTCPVIFENTVGEKPLNTPWAAMELTGTLYSQESIGTSTQEDNRWDEEGILWFHVMVKAGTGGREARRIAKLFADLFRGQRLMNDSLEFMDAEIGLGEPGDDNGRWYRVSVSIDWRHENA